MPTTSAAGTTSAYYGPRGDPFMTSAAHQQFLSDHAQELLDFYQPQVADPSGGLVWLDEKGRRYPNRPLYLWINARMVHCFALAHLLGRPGADEVTLHGLRTLQGELRDRDHGGWYWSTGPGSEIDAHKEAYGHAFVILAAASAAEAGFDEAYELLEDALVVMEQRFYEPAAGRYRDTISGDWSTVDPYRGVNANMHSVEALLAASALPGKASLFSRAVSVARQAVGHVEAPGGWRLVEHFDTAWNPRPDYNRDRPDDQMRPYGSTVGHWLEWAKLLAQLWGAHPEPKPAWPLDTARTLFRHAFAEGWHPDGGFYYTVDFDGSPVNRQKLWWPAAEAIGAAAWLWRLTGDADYSRRYQQLWDYTRDHFIEKSGNWYPQLDEHNQPTAGVWEGRPDLYHTLQATLYGALPYPGGYASALRSVRQRATTGPVTEFHDHFSDRREGRL